MADKVKYTDTNGKSYTELKQKATDALTLTSSTFSWSQTVSVGTKCRSAQINEIMSALSTAYDNVYLGCTNNYTSMKSSLYGYGSCSHSCSANYSSDNTSNYTSHQSNYISCTSNYLTVYYSDKGSRSS